MGAEIEVKTEERTKRELELELENLQLKETVGFLQNEERLANAMYMTLAQNQVPIEVAFGAIGRLIRFLVREEVRAFNTLKTNTDIEVKKSEEVGESSE